MAFCPGTALAKIYIFHEGNRSAGSLCALKVPAPTWFGRSPQAGPTKPSAHPGVREAAGQSIMQGCTCKVVIDQGIIEMWSNICSRYHLCQPFILLNNRALCRGIASTSRLDQYGCSPPSRGSEIPAYSPMLRCLDHAGICGSIFVICKDALRS